MLAGRARKAKLRINCRCNCAFVCDVPSSSPSIKENKQFWVSPITPETVLQLKFKPLLLLPVISSKHSAPVTSPEVGYVSRANKQLPRREGKVCFFYTVCPHWPWPPISHSSIAARPHRTGHRVLIMMCGPPGSSIPPQPPPFFFFFSTHIWQR